MKIKINHWKCSVCKRKITYYDDDSETLTHEHHFDLERSYKDLELDDAYDKKDETKYIHEKISNRNTKMSRQICRECFEIILSESPTLSKLFEVPLTAFKKDFRNAMKNTKWVY